jgi:hypothetical protein
MLALTYTLLLSLDVMYGTIFFVCRLGTWCHYYMVPFSVEILLACLLGDLLRLSRPNKVLTSLL